MNNININASLNFTLEHDDILIYVMFNDKNNIASKTLEFTVAGHRVCVNLTHMAGKSFIVAELDVNGCEKNILCKRVLSVESISDELNELTNIEFIIRKTASLIKLYTMYM